MNFIQNLAYFLKSDQTLVKEALEQGELGEAEQILENSNMDQELKEYKQEIFSEKLEEGNYRDAASYGLETDIDQKWMQDQARTIAEKLLVHDELGDYFQARRVGELMKNFNIEPEVSTSDLEDPQDHVPDRKAEERITDRIINKKDPEYIDLEEVDVNYPEFIDPNEIRSTIENREFGYEHETVETGLENYSRDADIYDKLDIAWVKTEELEKLLNQNSYHA